MGMVAEMAYEGEAKLVLRGRLLAGDGTERACASRAFDAHGAVLDVEGGIPEGGESLVVYLDSLGSFHATVLMRVAGGVRVGFACTQSRREKVLARVAWLTGEGAGTSAENRGAMRIEPRHSAVRLVSRVGVREGKVLDVSQTGASIAVEGPWPEEGESVTVGLRRASVVRLTEGGYAVKFAMPLPANSFDHNVVL